MKKFLALLLSAVMTMSLAACGNSGTPSDSGASQGSASGSDTSTGATGAQLAQFMASQGCVTAYNLDGGDTALMWFGGEYYSRQTKRAQSDIIYFATAVDFGLDGTEE